MIAFGGLTGLQKTTTNGPPGSDVKEQQKKSLIQNTVTYLKGKLENGGELPADDLEYFTSQLITIDTTRYHLVDGKAVAKEGSDPLLEVKTMLEELKRQIGVSNCDALLQRLTERMSTKAETALLAIESSPTKVHRSRSKSRPRSLDDEGELGAKSNKQAKLDSEQTSAKSNEVSTQGANLTNDDELADLDSRLDSRAEEADKVTGEKDSIPEGGEEQEEKKEEEEKEKEKEEEKKKEKTAEVKKADKKTMESADCVEVGNKVEETEFPPLGTTPKRIVKPPKATTPPLGKNRKGKR